jgi:hypothetical protein
VRPDLKGRTRPGGRGALPSPGRRWPQFTTTCGPRAVATVDTPGIPARRRSQSVAGTPVADARKAAALRAGRGLLGLCEPRAEQGDPCPRSVRQHAGRFRSCRIEDVARAHAYALIGMLTRNLESNPKAATISNSASSLVSRPRLPNTCGCQSLRGRGGPCADHPDFVGSLERSAVRALASAGSGCLARPHRGYPGPAGRR